MDKTPTYTNHENIHKNHRLRMKATFLKHGFTAFSDVEKLEFILYYAIAQKDTNPIAHNLLKKFDTFDRVLEAPVEALCEVDGMGEHSAILLHMILQVAAEYGKSKNQAFIKGSLSAKQYAINLFKGSFVEEFYVICLNTSNKVLTTKLVNRGTTSEVPVDIRALTNIALANQCERIIICHNHPKGKASPSDEDLTFTSKILFSCIINNIEVIDHIIVAGDNAFSFEESQILPELKRDAVRKIPCSQATREKFGQSSSNYLVGK